MKKTILTKKSTKLSSAPATPAAIAPAPVLERTTRLPLVKKPAAAASSQTTVITATIDVGFGNALYIRGEGPGLNWTEGVALKCVDDDRWTLAIDSARAPVTFKFLLNDKVWSEGTDYVIEAGRNETFAPSFANHA